jgi:hypothetical protein
VLELFFGLGEVSASSAVIHETDHALERMERMEEKEDVERRGQGGEAVIRR